MSFFGCLRISFDIQNYSQYVFNFFGFMQKHLWRIIFINIKIKTKLG